MAGTRPTPPARPTPRPIRVIGTLNVLFGALLLAVGWVSFSGTAFSGLSAAPNAALERALGEQAAREHREALARLEDLEAGAGFESAREIYRAERERLEARGPMLSHEARMMTMGDRMGPFMAWAAADALTSAALNLLMIASGVGLLQRVEWGRRLGLWAAGLKVARLVVIQGVFLAFVVPPVSRALGEVVGESMAAQGTAMPAGMPNMTQLYAVTYSAWGVAMLVLGPVYPIVVLVVLTRPGARAACEPAAARGRAMLQEARRA